MTIHIGYHKTATTFLQRSLFPKDDVFDTPWTIADLDELIARPAPFTFDIDATRSELDKRAGRGKGRIVVSHEDFVGHPLRGGVNGPEIASRLIDLFPNVKILVVVREQTTMLVSMYKQYIRGGGALRLERFVAPLPSERRNPSFSLDHYTYDRLVSFYMKHLGPDRVTVIPFELLRRNAGEFIHEVCAAIGVEHAPDIPTGVVNHGTSAVGTMIKRPLNHMFIRDAVNPAPLLPLDAISRPMDSAIRRLDSHLPNRAFERYESKLKQRACDIIGDRFAESNRILNEFTRFDLADFGYPLAD